MRAAIVLAAIVGFAGLAHAAEGPTMEQCQAGWKDDYAKMWTANDFKMACAKMMGTTKGTSDPKMGK